MGQSTKRLFSKVTQSPSQASHSPGNAGESPTNQKRHSRSTPALVGFPKLSNCKMGERELSGQGAPVLDCRTNTETFSDKQNISGFPQCFALRKYHPPSLQLELHEIRCQGPLKLSCCFIGLPPQAHPNLHGGHYSSPSQLNQVSYSILKYLLSQAQCLITTYF